MEAMELLLEERDRDDEDARMEARSAWPLMGLCNGFAEEAGLPVEEEDRWVEPDRAVGALTCCGDALGAGTPLLEFVAELLVESAVEATIGKEEAEVEEEEAAAARAENSKCMLNLGRCCKCAGSAAVRRAASSGASS